VKRVREDRKEVRVVGDGKWRRAAMSMEQLVQRAVSYISNVVV
jgi:hypothetical protein